MGMFRKKFPGKQEELVVYINDLDSLLTVTYKMRTWEINI
jgi:hypothetical protein